VAVAAVLHGLNDWSRVNGHPVWILVVVVSGILFLGYAKVGSRGTEDLAQAQAPPFLQLHPRPDGAGAPAGPRPVAPAADTAGGGPAHTRARRPWWEH
jgi:hypothetical protein